MKTKLVVIVFRFLFAWGDRQSRCIASPGTFRSDAGRSAFEIGDGNDGILCAIFGRRGKTSARRAASGGLTCQGLLQAGADSPWVGLGGAEGSAACLVARTSRCTTWAVCTAESRASRGGHHHPRRGQGKADGGPNCPAGPRTRNEPGAAQALDVKVGDECCSAEGPAATSRSMARSRRS